MNLTQLLAQTYRIPSSSQSQPAVYVLGRSPCLAIKYLRAAEQQVSVSAIFMPLTGI